MEIARKKKLCKSCGEEKYIFSKGNCEQCSKKTTPKIKAATPKAIEKRKEDRKDFRDFFKKAIEELERNPFCQNCGGEIKTFLHPVNNVAHILKKSKYKSVSTHPENYIFLCSDKDEVFSCHERFDNKISERKNMECFKLAYIKFKKFEDQVLESGIERTIFEEN